MVLLLLPTNGYWSVQLKLANGLTVATITQFADHAPVNVFGDEVDATVSHHGMATACMEAERFVVRTAVVKAPETVGGTALGNAVVVDDIFRTTGDRCVRRTRNTVAGVRIGLTVWAGFANAAHFG